MVERSAVTFSISEDVKERWKRYVVEHKGKYRGEAGRLVEKALLEYMDRDRHARLEENQKDILEKLDGLEEALGSDSGVTHTQEHEREALPKNMAVPEKARKIMERVKEQYGEDGCVGESDLERIIGRLAGGDSRTVEKYKNEIKSQRLAFKLPYGSAWFFDEGTWFANFTDMTLPTDDFRERIENRSRHSWENHAEKEGHLTVTKGDLRRAYGYSHGELEEKLDKHSDSPEPEEDDTQANSSGVDPDTPDGIDGSTASEVAGD